MKCPSLSFLMTLDCKSILLDIRMATLAGFFRPFAQKIVFQPFILGQCLSFSLRLVSCKQHNVGSCLISQSVNLCLFIGEMSTLILGNIKEKQQLLPIILLLKLAFCSCGCLLLGLLKDYFLAFYRTWFPSLYCLLFLLLSFEGLDSCKGNV